MPDEAPSEKTPKRHMRLNHAAKFRQVYGASWPREQTDLDIEMSCIRLGGRWISRTTGRECGLGLEYHYRAMDRLLWPDDVWDEWDAKIDRQLIKGGVQGLVGPSSAGKTNRMAKFALRLYWTFPSETTVLLSTTTLDLLDYRIWGEVKKYYVLGRERFPDLPGYLRDSARSITTDGAEVEGRDFRNGVKGLACFPSDAMVDTPTGPKSISSIKIGDSVINCSGVGRVKRLYYRRTSSLVRVNLEDGRSIECTDDHPFFTSRGWVTAIDLTISDMVFSANETMQMLRGRYKLPISQQQVLPSVQKQPSFDEMRLLRNRIPTCAQKAWPVQGSFLRSSMREPLEGGKQASEVCFKTVQTLRESNGKSSPKPSVLFADLQKQDCSKAVPVLQEAIQLNSTQTVKSKDSILQPFLRTERDGQKSSPKRQGPDARGVSCLATLLRSELEFPHKDWPETKERIGSLVQNGSGFYRYESGCGDRWGSSPDTSSGNERQTEDKAIKGTWVDSVEILESRGDSRFDESKGGYLVHNLEVEGHPSYSVNGVIVHNCKKGDRWVGLGEYVGIKNKRVVLFADEGHLMPPGYFESTGNLKSNPWFLLGASGNPKDPTDSFGHVCEPTVGYDLLHQGMGDQVWETREGECLRLDGLTAPNLVNGPGKEPCKAKITHRYIEEIRKFGEGSWQWEMWVRARFLLNIMEKRLFVRKFAERYHAFEDPEWSDLPLTNLLAIDAAYGSVGGDRCVAGNFRFGMCTDGKTRLALREGPMLIPVKAGGEVLPEIQIVQWTKEYCQRNDIVPAHVGLDSTGRGSLVSAFGQHWSPDIVAIEFGGSPSERPDPQQPKRLAKDAYVKFVTELAFALRSCIESDQFRGITMDIVLEAEQRAWENVGKPSKQEIETKEKTKERIKKSPDLLDMTIIGVELARRLGFNITSASAARTVTLEASAALRKAAEEWQQVNDEQSLEYA